jgi:hypothetical protein
VRELLALRRRHIVPRLRGARGGARLEILEGVLRVQWTLGDGARLRLLGHFGTEPAALPPPLEGEAIFSDGRVQVLLAPADG